MAISSAAGQRHVINRLGPGQVFGLIPVLDGSPWIHDARAHGPTELVRVPRASLMAAMQDHPERATQMVRCCVRARAACTRRWLRNHR